jgi:YjbR protein
VAEVPLETVERLRPLCLALPEAYEEEAWVGARWRVRRHTFAHVVRIEDGYPPAYARAAGTDGPVTVLTFRAAGPELDALTRTGHPYLKPAWFADIAGLVLDDCTDWDEVAELVTESYCILAPRRLTAQISRPEH